MDIKIKGINLDILREALTRAKEGRLYILEKMLATIPEPRSALSKAAPKITTFKIPKDKIGEVIGPGGKNIKSIKEEFNLDEIDMSCDIFVFYFFPYWNLYCNRILISY